MALNPYHHWLGIPRGKSPNYYDLLGLQAGESDLAAIQAAIEQRRLLIVSKRGTGHDEQVRSLLGHLDEAATTLLTDEFKRGYDRQLGQQRQAAVGLCRLLLRFWAGS
jgi:hypothetical protein